MSDNDGRQHVEGERVSIWSIRPRARHRYYVLFSGLVFAVIGLEVAGTVAAVIDGTIDSRHWWDTVTVVHRRIGAAAAPAVLVIAATALVITEVVEYIMVLSEKMYDNLQRTKKERHEKSREEGREEGLEAGREEVYGEVDRWNQRRLEAAAKGEPFDEHPPARMIGAMIDAA